MRRPILHLAALAALLTATSCSELGDVFDIQDAPPSTPQIFDEQEPNDNFSSATLSADKVGRFEYTGTLTNSADEDWFLVTGLTQELIWAFVTDLTDDVDIELLDIDGVTVLESSIRSGVSDEFLARVVELDEPTRSFYFRVYYGGSGTPVDTPYRLVIRVEDNFEQLVEDPEPNDFFWDYTTVSFGTGNFQMDGVLVDQNDEDYWWIEGDNVDTILMILHDVADSADVQFDIYGSSSSTPVVSVNKVGPDDQTWAWGDNMAPLNFPRYVIRVQATTPVTNMPYRITTWTR